MRPSCDSCRLGHLKCIYVADPDVTLMAALKRKHQQLQERVQTLKEVLGMLRSRPEHEAIAMLQRIRSTDVASALVMSRDRDPSSAQPSAEPQRLHDTLPPFSALTANVSATTAW